MKNSKDIVELEKKLRSYWLKWNNQLGRRLGLGWSLRFTILVVDYGWFWKRYFLLSTWRKQGWTLGWSRFCWRHWNWMISMLWCSLKHWGIQIYGWWK